MDCKVTGAFLCLLVFSHFLSAEPFSTRDQNPLAMTQGLPLPASASLPAAGNISWSTTLNITNSLNIAHTANESIFLDYESHEFIPSTSIGFADNWALRVDLPIIYYGPGFLDKRIDRWHQFFRLPQGYRPDYPDNQFLLHYQYNGHTVINTSQASTSLGDSQVSFGKQIIDSGARALSFWLTADLPTGNANTPSSSKKTNWILQLAGEHKLGNDWLTDANLAVTLPGDRTLNSAPVTSHIWSAQTGIEWRLSSSVSLRVQLDGHSAIYQNSGLRLLGTNYQLVFGGRLHLNRCSSFDFATSEDMKVDASPDVSFGIRYQHLAECH